MECLSIPIPKMPEGCDCHQIGPGHLDQAPVAGEPQATAISEMTAVAKAGDSSTRTGARCIHCGKVDIGEVSG
jgi:hypothetical protein